MVEIVNEESGRRRVDPGFGRVLLVSYGVTCVLIVVLLFAGSGFHDNPMRYFGEGRPGTTASVIAFLLGGITSVRVWRLLRPHSFGRFWFIAALGLFFLAIDEQFKVHETMDVVINGWLGADPDAPGPDRLDNLIVIAYAPVAGILAWPYRRALLRLRMMIAMLGIGFVFFGAMAFLDDGVWGTRANVAGAAEESFKLLSAVSIMNAMIAAKRALADETDAAVQASARPHGTA